MWYNEEHGKSPNEMKVKMYRIATVLLAVSVAFGMRLSASAETIFENWSEKTARVRIDADGALETAPGILVKGKWPYGFQEIVLAGEVK